MNSNGYIVPMITGKTSFDENKSTLISPISKHNQIDLENSFAFKFDQVKQHHLIKHNMHYRAKSEFDPNSLTKNSMQQENSHDFLKQKLGLFKSDILSLNSSKKSLNALKKSKN